MITCDEARIQLTLLQDKELSGEPRRSLLAHLNLCSTCLREFRDMEASEALLKQCHGIEPSPDFKSKVWRRIELFEQQHAVPRFAKIKEFISVRNWQFAAMSAALVVLFFAAYTLYTPKTKILITELDKFDNQLLHEVNRLVDSEADEYLPLFDEPSSTNASDGKSTLSEKKSRGDKK